MTSNPQKLTLSCIINPIQENPVLNIISSGRTDVGRRREHNEDSFGTFDGLGLYVVADGMGGHAAGEVASRIAVETLKAFIEATDGPDEITWPVPVDLALPRDANRLLAGVRLANQEVLKHAQGRPELRGMGTTIVAALVCGDVLHLAHAGDSRAYLYRDGAIRRVTIDHSYVEELMLAGHLTPEQTRTHPLRNIITRALGTKADVNVDHSRHDVLPGDVFLLCSDGLSNMLSDGLIEEVVAAKKDDLTGCAEALVRLANERGGDDNITVVLIGSR